MAYNDNSINRDVILNYALSTYGTEPEYPWESRKIPTPRRSLPA